MLITVALLQLILGQCRRTFEACFCVQAESKAAIAKLLELKKKFNKATGGDYRPEPATLATQSETATADMAPSQVTSPDSSEFNRAEALHKEIEEQGNKVR